jgi:hypothetical protein
LHFRRHDTQYLGVQQCTIRRLVPYPDELLLISFDVSLFLVTLVFIASTKGLLQLTRKVLLDYIRIRFVHFSKLNVERYKGPLPGNNGYQSNFRKPKLAHIAWDLLSAVAVRISLQWAEDIDYKLLDAIILVLAWTGHRFWFRITQYWGV